MAASRFPSDLFLDDFSPLGPFVFSPSAEEELSSLDSYFLGAFFQAGRIRICESRAKPPLLSSDSLDLVFFLFL